MAAGNPLPALSQLITNYRPAANYDNKLIRDPLSDYKKWEKLKRKAQRIETYGTSLNSVLRQLNDKDAFARQRARGQFISRFNMGYTGSGRYRRRRRFRRRYRGRGMYYGGRGSFAKSLSKGMNHLTTRKFRKGMGDLLLTGANTAMSVAAAQSGVPLTPSQPQTSYNQTMPGPPESAYGTQYAYQQPPWYMPFMSYMYGGGMNNMYGYGSYSSSKDGSGNNIITDSASAGAVPSFGSMNDEQGDIVISHREYIGDIYGNPSGETFSVDSFSLNPGVEKTFKWLSQIAANFTEYEFLQLMFSFRSTVTDIGSSTSGQVGTIIMATQYNPDEEPFSDKSTMMQYAHANSDKVTAPQNHGVECDPKHNAGPAVKYIRSNPLADQTGDTVRYDHGTFNIGIHGTPDGFKDQSIGELWVSYTVKLNKPRLFSGVGKAISQDLFVNNPSYTPSTSNLIGSNWLSGSENGIGGTLANSDNCGWKYTFPSDFHGHVEFVYTVEGSGLTFSNRTYATTGEVDAVNDIYATGTSTDDTPTNNSNANSTTGSVNIAHYVVKNNTQADNNTVSLDFVVNGTLSQWCVIVREYNPTSNTPPFFHDQNGLITAAA